MRRALVVITLLLVAGGALAFLLYRVTRKPLPTPVGWRAHVSSFAGDGAPLVRDGKKPAETGFSDPFGIAVTREGTVYISDAGGSNRIRRITPEGVVSTLAGGSEGFADGTGAAAAFNTPSGLALDADGNVYVADTGNNRIRRVSPTGEVTTIGGDGSAGYVDGPAAQARFNGPIGVAVDKDKTVFVADTYNDRIRRITPDGQVSTVTGAGVFDTPCGIVVAVDGTVIVADTGNNQLRKITADGNVSTIDVSGESLSSPIGLALTHDNFLYVTELDRSRVVQLAPDGTARLVAGINPGFGDGIDTARFNHPTAVAVFSPNNQPATLYVADSANYLVRKLDQSTPDANATRADDLPRLTRQTLAPNSLIWPLDPQERPHEVVATMGEVRGSFDSTDSRDHLHSGLDVFGAYGDTVRAIRSEKVTGPLCNWGFASLNEGMRIDVMSYVHLQVGRDKDSKMFDDSRFIPLNAPDGKLVRVRIKRGTRFKSGDALGTINRMYHVHLIVGPTGGEINPLSLAPVGFADDVAPTIEKNGIQLLDESGKQLADKQNNRLLVSGRVHIVVDAYDRTNLNSQRRRLGLYRLGYQVLKPDGSPAPGFAEPRVTLLFNRLPPDRDGAKIAYAAESGITVYGSEITRFLYEVTNIVRDGHAARGVWDTTQLPPGDYTLRILAADYSGNEVQEDRDLPLTIR